MSGMAKQDHRRRDDRQSPEESSAEIVESELGDASAATEEGNPQTAIQRQSELIGASVKLALVRAAEAKGLTAGEKLMVGHRARRLIQRNTDIVERALSTGILATRSLGEKRVRRPDGSLGVERTELRWKQTFNETELKQALIVCSRARNAGLEEVLRARARTRIDFATLGRMFELRERSRAEIEHQEDCLQSIVEANFGDVLAEDQSFGDYWEELTPADRQRAFQDLSVLILDKPKESSRAKAIKLYRHIGDVEHAIEILDAIVERAINSERVLELLVRDLDAGGCVPTDIGSYIKFAEGGKRKRNYNRFS